MFPLIGKYTTAYIMIDEVEESCISQIIQMINHEAFTNKVIIMPDCHYGKGSVIGFTMPVSDKVIPNVVGVDKGCGMLSFNVGDIVVNHKELDIRIRQSIPLGQNINKKSKSDLHNSGYELCKKLGINSDYVVHSIGTLGGGNHFIEIGKSVTNNDVWVTIHSGSRNLGKKVCEYWQKIASIRKLPDKNIAIKEIKETYPKKEWDKKIKQLNNERRRLKPSPLDFLEGDNKDSYLKDMYFCQDYAKLNRKTIMESIISILKNDLKISVDIKDQIETIHNYIDPKDGIIRKGAIRSYIGERMLIPFNMRDGILICEGKSNSEWNYSAPHGAGRNHSRAKAKEDLDIEKFKNDMEGIFSTSVCMATIDESPDAYKDSKIIEKAIEPTATILDRIIPIHNIKDSTEVKPWKKS